MTGRPPRPLPQPSNPPRRAPPSPPPPSPHPPPAAPLLPSLLLLRPPHQALAVLHGIALAHEHLFYHAGLGRGNLVLHLHRFHHHQALPHLHRLARRHQHANDLARHGRADFLAASTPESAAATTRPAPPPPAPPPRAARARSPRRLLPASPGSDKPQAVRGGSDLCERGRDRGG